MLGDSAFHNHLRIDEHVAVAGVEYFRMPLEFVGHKDIIRIEQSNIGSARYIEAEVACARGTAIAFADIDESSVTKTNDYLFEFWAVVGTIVDDQTFKVLERLSLNRA